MADIKIAFPIIVSDNKGGGYEGVYSNDVNDPAGLTIYGLEQTDDGDWSMWPTVKTIVKAGGTTAQITSKIVSNSSIYNSALIYHKTKYWDPLGLDNIENQLLANELYSIGLNIGLKNAGLYLQQVLNSLSLNGGYGLLTVDGNVGSKTISAANANTNQSFLIHGLAWMHGSYYINLVTTKPSFKSFMNGWFNRVIGVTGF